jgi:hypothetical protein
MKRAAASLVERRTERFESRHGLAQSQARLATALERARIGHPWPFAAQWSEAGGGAVLEATYEPSAKAKRFLELASLAFVLLAAATGWTLMRSDNAALRFLLPLTLVLLVLGFPFVTLALASQRAAIESRVRRAVRTALQDEDESFPPPQRWGDED